ncbi:MAG: hypothetical protein ACK5IN_01610 [Microbacterium sp.]|uniref:hypothetical protein n=1 Tax=Microbacterium sp. TaxID=51671 RepID=UPI003A840AF5
MTDDRFAEQTDTPVAEALPPQYGVGPFTIREVALLAVWVAAFVVSFFPLLTGSVSAALGAGLSVWTVGLDWILTIGVPTVALFLIVLRRFSPQGIRRVGSLGIDQFASVAFSVSTVVWLVVLWQTVSVAISAGTWVRTWVVWVEFFLMLAGVVLTVAAPIIPPFAQDFQGRPEAPAHRSARHVREVTARPPRPRPVPDAEPASGSGSNPDAEPGSDSAWAPPAEAVNQTEAETVSEFAPQPAVEPEPVPALEPEPVPASEPVAVPEPVPEPEPVPAHEPEPEQPLAAQQAFWALAPVERDVHDERGMPMFRIGPTAWALVIEDRGSLFVIRHEDGRIGYLHDVTGVIRG